MHDALYAYDVLEVFVVSDVCSMCSTFDAFDVLDVFDVLELFDVINVLHLLDVLHAFDAFDAFDAFAVKDERLRCLRRRNAGEVSCDYSTLLRLPDRRPQVRILRARDKRLADSES